MQKYDWIKYLSAKFKIFLSSNFQCYKYDIKYFKNNTKNI